MVRSYFRYSEEASWGVVVSGAGHIVAQSDGRVALSPMLEDVCAWSVRHGGIERRLRPAVASEATALELSPSGELLAVGYSDGSVRLWSMHGSEGEAAAATAAPETERVTLSGHRSAVLSLCFSADGAQLASGGNDTLVVLWDVVGEAGICKLRGHRGAVTGVCLLASLNALASVSKDGTLRIWDLDTQHCVQTCPSPSGELWSVCAREAAGTLLTGGAGGELLLWTVARAVVDVGQRLATDDANAEGAAAATPPASGGVAPPERLWKAAQAVLCGAIATSSSAKVSQIRHSADGGCVGVLFSDKTMGVWRVRDGEERLKKASKRRAEKAKKKKKLGKAGGEAAAEEEEEEEDGDGATAGATEAALAAFEPVCGLRGSHKLHSFAFLASRPKPAGAGGSSKRAKAAPVRLLVAQRDNSASTWEVDLEARTATQLSGGAGACAAPAGHRAEPRAVALSGDDRLVVSVSDGEARVWSTATRQCTRSLSCGYGLCVAFVGANKHVAVGTKGGALQLFELATGELAWEDAAAHGGPIWSLDVAPGGGGLLTAGADKRVGTWSLREGGGSASLVQEQSIETGDDAMCARFTPDGAKVLVGLLDATVKVVHLDSQQTHLVLYGHKLPVLAVGASSDGQMAASGSADKSLKLWGLDYGDMHRSIYAHTEAVTSLAWVPRTHYLFTGGKDKLIKHWDADTFELIHVLRGHHAEVWGVAVSRSGELLVSAARDRSLRLWARSEEQVFLEEEREAEVEAVLDASLEKQQQAAEAEEEEAAALGLDGRADAESGAAGRRTLESVKGAERVLEALTVLDDEAERAAEYRAALTRWQALPGERPEPVLVPNLLLLGLAPGAYLLRALGGVRPAELEQALLLLPFDSVRRLLARLLPLLEAEAPIELMARCVLYLLRVHHKPLVSNRSLIDLLHPIAAALQSRVARERAMLGYNVAALGFLKQAMERTGGGAFFEEALSSAAAPRASVAELRRKTAAREKAGAGKRTKPRDTGAA